MSNQIKNLTVKGGQLLAKRTFNPELTKWHSLLKNMTLKASRRVLFKFDPFHPKTSTIQELLFHMNSKRVRGTHPECAVRADIQSDFSEPEITFFLVNGKKMVYQTSHLNKEDVLLHYNQISKEILSNLEE